MEGADRMKRFTSLLAAILVAGPALSAPSLPGPGKYAGAWTLAGGSEGAAACTVQLKTATTIGGYVIAAPKACAKVFAASADISAWRPAPGGKIAFADPLRHTVLAFEPTAQGDFAAAMGRDSVLVLSRVRPARPQGMSGAWRLNGLGGVPLCALTLSMDKSGHGGAARRDGPCKAPWASKTFAAWSTSAGRLVLKDGAGHVLVGFKRDDAVTYEAGTSSGDLIFLVRP